LNSVVERRQEPEGTAPAPAPRSGMARGLA
jgi:hypothetical protein